MNVYELQRNKTAPLTVWLLSTHKEVIISVTWGGSGALTQTKENKDENKSTEDDFELKGSFSRNLTLCSKLYQQFDNG